MGRRGGFGGRWIYIYTVRHGVKRELVGFSDLDERCDAMLGVGSVWIGLSIGIGIGGGVISRGLLRCGRRRVGVMVIGSGGY